MSYEKSVLNFFKKVEDRVDEAHTLVMAIVDEVTVVVDKALSEWQRRAIELARLQDGTHTAKADEVKVAPSVEVMKDDIVTYFHNNGVPTFRKDNLYNDTEQTVTEFWHHNLSDHDKSWVRHSGDSPL